MKTHKLNARGPRHLQKLKYTNCSKITQNADNDKASLCHAAANSDTETPAHPALSSFPQIQLKSISIRDVRPKEEGWYQGRDSSYENKRTALKPVCCCLELQLHLYHPFPGENDIQCKQAWLFNYSSIKRFTERHLRNITF